MKPTIIDLTSPTKQLLMSLDNRMLVHFFMLGDRTSRSILKYYNSDPLGVYLTLEIRFFS